MPTPFPTDWNQYLSTLGQPPTAEEAGAPVDPMATFQMPTGGVSPEQIGRGIEFMYGLQKHREAGRTAAMRWAGMNDFAKMRAELEGQGIASDEAVRRAYAANAHKIHAYDPAGFERAMTVVGRRPTTTTPKASFADTAQAKLLMDQVNYAQTQAQALEKRRAMGDMTTETARELITAREALDKTYKAYLAHVQGVDARLQSPMPGTAMPVPARPAAPAPAPIGAAPTVVRVQRKSDGAVFTYRGNAADVPKDKYDILP